MKKIMKKKTKSNFLNEFNEKVLSGGDYAYVYDKENSSLISSADGTWEM